MPFARPTLTALRQRVAQDIAASLPGADALLRFSNLGVMGDAQAGLASLHYGYLDWIAQQSNPFTATGEYLEAWAALVKVFRKAATVGAGSVTFPGTNGVPLPSGTTLVRGDGVQFITTSIGVIAAGVVTVNASGVADPAGLVGATTNTAASTVINLSQSIAGIQSNGSVSIAFVGGADLELDDALRGRMLAAYQAMPQGGCSTDYVKWALEFPGVTRAWCTPNGFGAGTVVVYTMLDNTEALHAGFPQGTNGVSSSEPRDTAAIGDQLLIANYIYLLQPATALVYSVAPIASATNFTITGIPAASRAAVTSALSNLLLREGVANGGKIILAHAWSAIAAVSGVNDFVLNSPTADIVTAPGYLPVIGTPTYL
jgi:uncharacterized phage protein gp47/JayE